MGGDIFGRSWYVYLGYDASASGDTVVLGVPECDLPSGLERAGEVQVHRFNAALNHWIQVGNSIYQCGGRLGTAVALSDDGSAFAASEPCYKASKHFLLEGCIRVFTLDGVGSGNWTQVGSTLYGDLPRDEAGISIDLSGDATRFVIGARYHDDSLLLGQQGYRGHVPIFDYRN